MKRTKLMTREQIIPNTYSVMHNVESLGALAVVDVTGLVVMAFSGKAKKPDFNYRFKTIESARAYVSDWLSGLEKKAAEKQAQEEKLQLEAAAVQVGDVFYSSWGYDQTNIDWYQVVGRKGSETVVLCEIASSRTRTESMAGSCTPKVGAFIGEQFSKRLHGAGVKISSFQWASAAAFTEEGGVKTYLPKNWTSYA